MKLNFFYIFSIFASILTNFACEPVDVPIEAPAAPFSTTTPTETTKPTQPPKPTQPSKPGQPSKPTQPFTPFAPSEKGSLGAFSFERKDHGPYPVIRYLHNNNVVTRNDFIDLLIKTDKDGQDFRTLVNQSIAQLPIPTGTNVGYQLQAPVINATTKDDSFYFLAIPDSGLGSGGGQQYTNYLWHCDPAPLGADKTKPDYQARFWRLFAANNNVSISMPSFLERKKDDTQPSLPFGAAVFKGGVPPTVSAQEIMVSPCPISDTLNDPKNEALGHIYLFAKAMADPAKKQRLQSFWYAVGKTARKMFDGTTVFDLDGTHQTQLFLSAHGHGIQYLHLRLENVPRYYSQEPDLTYEGLSASLYNKVFP